MRCGLTSLGITWYRRICLSSPTLLRRLSTLAGSVAEAHAQFLKLGIVDKDVLLATQLLNAYANEGTSYSTADARKLFDQTPLKDTVLWSSMISVYARIGNFDQALQLFVQMQMKDHAIRPNHFIFSTVLAACGAISALQHGQAIHTCVIKCGFQADVVVSTAVLSMYSKCFDVKASSQVFGEMPQRNIFTWNAMLACYASNGAEEITLSLFYHMTKTCSEFKPDEFAVVTVLTAIAGIADISSGLQIHGYLVKSGFESDLATANALINMYFKCGRIKDAEIAYTSMRRRDRISFRLMIMGYVYVRRFLQALKFFSQIRDVGIVEIVDSTVITSLLSVCSNLVFLRLGRQIHAIVIILNASRKQCPSYTDYANNDANIVVTTAILDMYCKCYSIREAQLVFNNLQNKHISHWNSLITGYIHNGLLKIAVKLFDEMPERNLISWTAIITGYVQSGLPFECLHLLEKMYREDGVTKGNCFTFTAALAACALITSLRMGKEIHAQAVRTMAEDAVSNNVVLGTALIDMYSKSGDLNYARKIFYQLEERNVLCWTSMIAGYAAHGLGSRALGLFQEMVETGLEPNEVTFIAVLNACSHGGLVEEGIELFNSMKQKHGIIPRGDHYACIVDLLGRVGRLRDAQGMIEEMETGAVKGGDSDSSAWGALLGGCKLHGDVEMGRWAARRILEMKYQVPATYVLLSNVYAEAGMWNEVYKVREEWRRQTGELKEPGCSQLRC